jgi:hypothetical protein
MSELSSENSFCLIFSFLPCSRHITVADIDSSALGGKSGVFKALAACPLDWHMRDAATTKTGGEVLEQWDVPGWGKEWVIKVKSSDALDTYADCLFKHLKKAISNVKGPKYSGTAWHVTLYGENKKTAEKSFSVYTAEKPRLDWYAYYLVVSGSPKNGVPGSAYHLTRV